MNAILLLALAVVPGQTPALVCENAVVDRGSLRGGPTIKQSFTVVNRGSGDVAIVHAQPSCGCLAPNFSKRTLTPGQSATVEIQIGTLTQPEGDNLWTVRLFYRTASSEVDNVLDLQVKAKLTREVGIEPAALRLAGKPGLAHQLTLTDRRAKPFEITRIVPSSDRLIAAADAGWQKATDGWVRTIHVAISATCPSGRQDEAVQIFSSDPDYRELRVPITVVRTDRQRFLVAPGQVALEATTSATVLIRDQQGEPVEIESIEADDASLTCQITAGAAATAAVKVSVKPGSTPARWSILRVQIKAPAAQEVRVPVSCPGGK
jgi:hypothetical protein